MGIETSNIKEKDSILSSKKTARPSKSSIVPDTVDERKKSKISKVEFLDSKKTDEFQKASSNLEAVDVLKESNRRKESVENNLDIETSNIKEKDNILSSKKT